MRYKVYLSLGSNEGNRFLNITKALLEIARIDGTEIKAVSSFYRTEPYGYKKQREFINAAAEIITDKEPEEILSFIKKIEKKLGRKQRGKWRKREIDIDIIYYGRKVINTKFLIIPHPEISKRKFVLTPLNELNKKLKHPVTGKTTSQMIKELKDNLFTEIIE